SEIADIAALADIAHRHNCLLVVDNCFCTPALQQPLKLGADIVVHSASKYIDGQGRGVGGAIIGSQKLVGGDIYSFLRTAGPSMSPFNAWIYLKGLETLRLRMAAHSASALELAQWLEAHPAVTRVYYPGLKSHPQHALAARQQSAFGGVLAFEIKGGREAAWEVIDATHIISITATFGDSKSTITHPASTTHHRLTPEARAAAGITEGLLRIGVGLEDVEDLKADLARGLRSL
ncbi:MAG TPA: PLP-dependent transferase, partial [Gammaproteobacteria bacterium]|nr:PLP-dependent transferase [Gammaproteobacteria bacterium]